LTALTNERRFFRAIHGPVVLEKPPQY
jgi:hypothetical protein